VSPNEHSRQLAVRALLEDGLGPRRRAVAKVRVHELAKEFGVPSKTVLATLSDMGEYVRSASSTVEAPVVRRLNEQFGDELRAQGDAKKKSTTKKAAEQKQPARAGEAQAGNE